MQSKPQLRVLACGGRDYADAKRVAWALEALGTIEVLIEGGAPRGADRLAADWARSKGYRVETYRAAWKDLTQPGRKIRYRQNGTAYDAAAGGRRNQRMLDEGRPDVVVAFPGGTGTADMVDRARKAGVHILTVLAS